MVQSAPNLLRAWVSFELDAHHGDFLREHILCFLFDSVCRATYTVRVVRTGIDERSMSTSRDGYKMAAFFKEREAESRSLNSIDLGSDEILLCSCSLETF